jgi:hypothetical protein
LDALDLDRAEEHNRLVAKPHELAVDGNVTVVILALEAWHISREGDSTNALVNTNPPLAMTPRSASAWWT